MAWTAQDVSSVRGIGRGVYEQSWTQWQLDSGVVGSDIIHTKTGISGRYWPGYDHSSQSSQGRRLVKTFPLEDAFKETTIHRHP
jgi:hypothetical protein